MKSLYLLGISLLMATGIFADDAILGSEGGNVFLSKSEDIQMVKEVVRINMEKDKCRVHCKFWFYNQAKSDINAFVGFPNYYISPAISPLPITEFTCHVNGKPVQVDEKREIDTLSVASGADSSEAINDWFSWPTTFPAGDTTIIENDYVGKWGLSPHDLRTFDYLLGTGRSWNGPIIDGTIIVDHSQIASSNFVFASSTDTNAISITVWNDSSVFRFRNLMPKSDERIVVEVICFWDNADANGFGAPILNADGIWYKDRYRETIFELMKEKGLDPQNMINEIYARRGYIFSNAKLQDYFSHTSWYKPNKNFSPQDFSMYEELTINYLKEYENLK
jgi:hypothetical protein